MNAHAAIKTNGLATSGVQGWSSPCAFESYVIFCVGNDKYKEAAFRQWATENGIGFKSMIGCYNGVTECSFMVNQRELGRTRQWWQDQESILVFGPLYRSGRMYGSRIADLVYIEDGQETATVTLGYMNRVTKEYALEQPSWTYDPYTEEYWIAG